MGLKSRRIYPEWPPMIVRITFYSYFKDLTGVARTEETLPEGSTIGDLHHRLAERFPQLAPLQKSTLIAVGVDYQRRDYSLKEGDEVSLFPPVQGG
jgi:molybdopterin converting factor small subunit